MKQCSGSAFRQTAAINLRFLIITFFLHQIIAKHISVFNNNLMRFNGCISSFQIGGFCR